MERKGSISAFDLDICKGEVLGLAGLLGSGRTEIARLLFGIDRPQKGTTRLNGREVAITSPRKAIGYFFGLCPEDRKTEGIICGFDREGKYYSGHPGTRRNFQNHTAKETG